MAIVIVMAIVLAFFYGKKTGKPEKVDPRIELEFNKVFMTTSNDGKEGLIQRGIDKKKCGRGEAMRLAVEEVAPGKKMIDCSSQGGTFDIPRLGAGARLLTRVQCW